MQQNDLNNIFDSLKNNKADDEKVSSAMEKLSDKQKNTLFEILGDRERMSEFLSSPKAQMLMNKLKGE